MPDVCPTPGKKRYATAEVAQAAAERSAISIGQQLHPYQCPCGWLHLSKQDRAPRDPSPETVALVAALGPEAFDDLVRRELRGRAHPEEAGALRRPEVATRWEAALCLIQIDLEGQFAARAGDRSEASMDWRRRASWVRTTVAGRRKEARACRRDYRPGRAPEEQATAAQANASAKVRRAEHVDGIVEASTSPAKDRELRRQAGEAAIDRLINAHGLEFSRYLAEECERVGATLPSRVRKYLMADQVGDAA
ncbi:hypothetical protein [Streptomyces syringium]|uniref:hypothetical protein n=1 Tax=Streptomyces syringium TaxID=76729 RepID=UPI0034520844